MMKNPLIMRIVGILAAIVVFAMIALLAQSAMSVVYPTPSSVDVKNKASLDAYTMSMPTMAYVLLIVGYWVASFAAGFVSVFVAKSNILTAIVVGVGLVVGCILNFMEIAHPLWVSILSCIGVLVFTWFGGRKAFHQFVLPQMNAQGQSPSI
jgi:hypothetical protein